MGRRKRKFWPGFSSPNVNEHLGGDAENEPGTDKEPKEDLGAIVKRDKKPFKFGTGAGATAAKSFRPHEFLNNVYFVARRPKVLITPLALQKMYHYVDICNLEIGWLGTVKETEHGDLLIEDVRLVKQKVTATQTQLSEEGLSEYAQELLSQPNGIDIWNRTRFWGHSHVNMGTSPSNQDDDQMKDFKEAGGHPYFIRGILNKKGRIEFTVYLYDTGVEIHDAEWAIEENADPEMAATIAQEISEKVEERKFYHYNGTSFPHNQVGSGSGYHSNNYRYGRDPRMSHDDPPAGGRSVTRVGGGQEPYEVNHGTQTDFSGSLD